MKAIRGSPRHFYRQARQGSLILVCCDVSDSSVVAVSLVMLAASLWAAGEGGRISGTIRDVTGAVIVDARVTATNSQTGATRSVSTDVSWSVQLQ